MSYANAVVQNNSEIKYAHERSSNIAKEYKTIADIEFLIHDIRVDLALKDLKREYMQTYSLVNSMNTLTV